VVLEISGGEDTVVRMVLFDLEAFVSSHSLKFDGAGDSLIHCIRLLREVEYFPTCMVNKKTSACVTILFFTKTVGQAALNGEKIMVCRYADPRLQIFSLEGHVLY
jgi:hypothetical protein